MGKIFTFYKKTKGNARVTTCMALIGTYIGKYTGKTVAITQIGEHGLFAEEIFGNNGKTSGTNMSGINGLMLLLKGGSLTRSKIMSCGMRVGKSNIFLFPGDIKASGDLKNTEKIRRFLYMQISECFDILLIDAGYRADSDEIYGDGVCVISQNLKSANEICYTEQRKASMFIINGFMENSINSKKKFLRVFDAQVHFIPMDAGILDACLYGRIMNFFGIFDLICGNLKELEVLETVENAVNGIMNMVKKGNTAEQGLNNRANGKIRGKTDCFEKGFSEREIYDGDNVCLEM